MVLLTVCVEKLISYLTRSAFGLQMSLFDLAILFTGFEFDDTVLALVLSAGELEGAALGTALGTGLSVVGVTLALAAIVHPFSVDLPTDYVVLLAVAPLLLIPFVREGTLTTVHGLLLLGSFVLMFGHILAREYQRDIPVFRSTELDVTGSVLYSLTGNVGVIMFVSDVTISRAVLTLHLPAVVATALAAYFFAQGRLNRRHGVLLECLYIAYWGIALFAIGGVPVGR